jgi:phospholipid/cholesterol/gamma-HCH transport system substrate-binding protein
MREQTKNLLIGIFVIISLAMTVLIILYLKPSIGDKKKVLYARFSNISKVKVGTQLLFAGKPVGEVVDIEVIPYAREQPTDELGRFYFYQLTIRYDSSVSIYTTDKVSIVTAGLLGEKAVAVTPQAPPKGVIPRLVGEHPVYADSVEEFDKLFYAFNKISGKVERALDTVTDWISENGPIISKVIQSFDASMQQFEFALTNFNESKIMDEVQRLIKDIDRITSQTSDILTQMGQNQVFNNVAIILDRIKEASGSIQTISAKIASGQGSLGKFIEGDDFYLKTMGVMSKVDTLMNDVNHYGVLFHLNKEWQRIRLKRITMLNALESPSEFKNFFQEEVDNISTSMERISMLIDKAEESPEKEKILNSLEFKRDFAELLRDVDELQNNLKLYSEEFANIQSCYN